MSTTIQIKRTNSQSSFTNNTLQYGEPLYAQGVNGGSYLVVGAEGGSTLANSCNMVRLTNQNVANSGVYYNSGNSKLYTLNNSGAAVQVNPAISSLAFNNGSANNVIYNGDVSRIIKAETLGALRANSTNISNNPQSNGSIASKEYVDVKVSNINKGYVVNSTQSTSSNRLN